MKFFLKFFRARKNSRGKKSYDLVKLHLTQTREKLNPYAVIKIFLHDFAQQVRIEEGVISNGS